MAQREHTIESSPRNGRTEAVIDSWLTVCARRLRHVSSLKSAVQTMRQARSAAIDRWLRIHTPYPNAEQYNLNTRFADPVPNEPVDYLLLRRFLQPIAMTPDDVVYDVGCGMGRALCMFARRGVKRCVGIEFDDRLAAIAKENARRVRGRRSECEVRVGDAIEADYADGTIFWLFNPFGEQTLAVVLDRIWCTLLQNPRSIQIVYVNPVHEHLLRSKPWLALTGRERSPFFNCYGASYWRSA